MKDYKGYLIDLDGTMYRGAEKIDGAKEFVEHLNKRSIPHLFLTNNSSRKAEQIAEKLVSMGIPSSAGKVVTSSLATAIYLSKWKKRARVYVIGEEGLYHALEQEGHEIVEDDADVVVVGIDRDISYEKLTKACLSVRDGARFISTNGDVAIPTERGMVPGNGSITSVISVSTGVEPQFIGKPESIIMNYALEILGFKKDEVLMVGDNYQTDIMAGIQAGIDTLMVETGVSSFEDIEGFNRQPTFKCKDLYEWMNRE